MELRKSLSVAHKMTAKLGMCELVWNHISARIGDDFLITPGNRLFADVEPEHLVKASDSVNCTGDVIHGAIYATRPDVNAIVHLHTPHVVAVGCLEEGLTCLSQDSGVFWGRTAYYDNEGISSDKEEQQRISAALGKDNHTLMMRNHGAVTVGATVEEAWVRMYYLDRACQVQILALSTGRPLRPLNDALLKHIRNQYEEDGSQYRHGLHEWPAIVRHLGSL